MFITCHNNFSSYLTVRNTCIYNDASSLSGLIVHCDLIARLAPPWTLGPMEWSPGVTMRNFYNCFLDERPRLIWFIFCHSHKIGTIKKPPTTMLVGSHRPHWWDRIREKKQKSSKNSKVGRLRVDICSIMQIFSTISLVHREAKSTTARRRSTAIMAPAGLALEATTSGGILVVQEKPPDFIGAGSMKQPWSRRLWKLTIMNCSGKTSRFRSGFRRELFTPCSTSIFCTRTRVDTVS